MSDCRTSCLTIVSQNGVRNQAGKDFAASTNSEGGPGPRRQHITLTGHDGRPIIDKQRSMSPLDLQKLLLSQGQDLTSLRSGSSFFLANGTARVLPVGSHEACREQ